MILTSFEFDEIKNFAAGDVNLHGVINFDQWIRIPDGSSVVSDQHWDSLWANCYFPDLAQLVLQLNQQQKNLLKLDVH